MTGMPVCLVVVVADDGEGMQRLRVVSRPTERDILWDEARGESIDPRELQLTPPPLEQNRGNPQPGPPHQIGRAPCRERV